MYREGTDFDFDRWRDWIADFPVLDRLRAECVFGVAVLVDGSVLFQEECDEHRELSLSPDQVRALAAELLKVADEAERN